MRTLSIRLGFTRCERADDYVPTMDGFRPGADQVFMQVDVAGFPGLDPDRPLSVADVESVASACFAAMNAPEDVHVSDAATLTRQAIDDQLASGQSTEGIHSLSVGDTVTVDGITLACEKKGWSVVG